MVEPTDTVKYGWVATKIVGTPSILNVETTIAIVDITFSDLLNYFVPLLRSEKMICSFFDGCFVPLYECMFTMIGLWLSFSEFEVTVMKHFPTSFGSMDL